MGPIAFSETSSVNSPLTLCRNPKAKNGINIDKFKSGMLHEKHAVTTWNIGNHLSICLKIEENHGNVSRWPVGGTFGCVLTFMQQSGKQKMDVRLQFPTLSLLH
jgi:hypothetical protein